MCLLFREMSIQVTYLHIFINHSFSSALPNGETNWKWVSPIKLTRGNDLTHLSYDHTQHRSTVIWSDKPNISSVLWLFPVRLSKILCLSLYKLTTNRKWVSPIKLTREMRWMVMTWILFRKEASYWITNSDYFCLSWAWFWALLRLYSK